MPRGKRKNVDQAENVGPDGTCTTAEVPTAAVLSAAAEQQQTFDASYVEELLEGISEEGEFSRLLTTNSTPRLLYDVSRGNTSPHAHFVLSSRCECPPFTAVSPNPGAAFKTTVEKRCNGIQQLADHKKKQQPGTGGPTEREENEEKRFPMTIFLRRCLFPEFRCLFRAQPRVSSPYSNRRRRP